MAETDYEAIAPDFTAAEYADERQALKHGPEITDAMAAATLKALWVVRQRATAAAEARAREESEAEAIEQARLDAEARAILLAAEEEAREAAIAEDRKKNKVKHATILEGVPLPSTRPLDIPPAVLRRLRSGGYVGLWHFTDEGMAKGAKDITAPASDSLPIGIDPDALRDGKIELTAGEKDLGTKKRDEDLTLDEFSVAGQRFLPAIRQAKWADHLIAMFGTFFTKITLHNMRTEVDVLGINRAALMIYVDAARRLWHERADINAINVEDIAAINPDIMKWAKERAYDRVRAARDAALLAQGSRVSSKKKF